LPRKQGDKLREKAAETGYLPDELGVELLRQGLNEELDPEDMVEQYRELSEKYLADAKELLNAGDLVQASEKLWGASAAKGGLKLEQHDSLWVFINMLAKENGDEDIVTFFGVANALHRNFYENEMPEETVKISAKDIEKSEAAGIDVTVPPQETLIDITTEIRCDRIVIEGEQFGWETGNGNLLNNPPLAPGEAVGGIKYDVKMIGLNGTTEFNTCFEVNTNVTPNLAVTKAIGYKSGDLGSLSYAEQVGMHYFGASPQ
jgi:hypothetical protein